MDFIKITKKYITLILNNSHLLENLKQILNKFKEIKKVSRMFLAILKEVHVLYKLMMKEVSGIVNLSKNIIHFKKKVKFLIQQNMKLQIMIKCN